MTNIKILASDSSANSYIINNIVVECGYAVSTVMRRGKENINGFVISHNHIDHARYFDQYQKKFPNLSNKYLYSTEIHGETYSKSFWFEEISLFFLTDCAKITKKPPKAKIYMIECNHDLEYIDEMNLWNVYYSRNSRNHLSLQSLIEYFNAGFFDLDAEFIFLHSSKVLLNIDIAKQKLSKYVKKIKFASENIIK